MRGKEGRYLLKTEAKRLRRTSKFGGSKMEGEEEEVDAEGHRP